MPASKITDLLPLPEGVTRPHAYQVFGLAGGETDDRKVTEAMRQVYDDLKAAKESCDPALWKKAAKIAEAARIVLEDPDKRRSLDARFAAAPEPIATASPEPASPVTAMAEQESQSDEDAFQAADEQEDDPLAGVLPPSNPLSGSPSGEEPEAVPGLPPLGTPALGTPPLGTPPMGAPPMGNGPAATSPQPMGTTAPVAAMEPSSAGSPSIEPAGGWSPPKTKTRKRRRKKTGMFVFGCFVLLMLGGIVGLLQFLTSGGRVAINQPPDGESKVVSPPMPEQQPPTPPKPPSDGILNDVPQSGVAESIRNPGGRNGSGLSAVNPMDNNFLKPPADMNAGNDSMGMTDTSPMAPGNPPPADPPPPKPATPDMSPPPSGDGMTPEMVAANAEKITELEQLIVGGDWDRMKPAAEALRNTTLSEQQISRVDALYDIADLASFYRGAISRGLATLSTGNNFEYVEGVEVIVVEVTATSLTIRFNRQSKTYTINDMPPRMCETIAAFSLERDRGDSIAGLALYRLIRSDTNEGYRADAWEKLESVDGILDGVDTKNLVRVARDLFAQPN